MDIQEIIQIRKDLEISQEKFAQLLGTTVVTINRWEKGKTRPSRLYLKELNKLKAKNGSHIYRRETTQDT